MPIPVLTVENLETHLASREGPVKALNKVSFTRGSERDAWHSGESGSGKT